MVTGFESKYTEILKGRTTQLNAMKRYFLLILFIDLYYALEGYFHLEVSLIMFSSHALLSTLE